MQSLYKGQNHTKPRFGKMKFVEFIVNAMIIVRYILYAMLPLNQKKKT